MADDSRAEPPEATLADIQASVDAVEASLALVEDDPARKSGKEFLHCILESGLYMGGEQVSSEALRAVGVTHVVRVLEDPSIPSVLPERELQGQLRIEVFDNMAADMRPHFSRIRKFIAEALQTGGRVYVHCGMGRSRAATAILCYLISEAGMDFLTAFTHVIVRRDISAINLGFISQLADLDEECHGKRSFPLLGVHVVKRNRADALVKSSRKATVAEIVELWLNPDLRTRDLHEGMAYISLKSGMRELRQLLTVEESPYLGPPPVTRSATDLRAWFEARAAEQVVA
mmetsp:Transcript_103418/g.170214  ORF Transcript_103418/g.170214 Transcript_103418/m.170214 type:complete len:288 (-) Transcript_103418:3-866(-)